MRRLTLVGTTQAVQEDCFHLFMVTVEVNHLLLSHVGLRNEFSPCHSDLEARPWNTIPIFGKLYTINLPLCLENR